MKKIIKQYAYKISGIIAPFALALAILTANSTCFYYTFQPNEPACMNKYRKK